MGRLAAKGERSWASVAVLLSLVALLASLPVAAAAVAAPVVATPGLALVAPEATPAPGAVQPGTAAGQAPRGPPEASPAARIYAKYRDRVSASLPRPFGGLEAELSRHLRQGYEQSCDGDASGSLSAPGRGVGRARPAWLDDVERGTNFNRAHQFDYPYRELYLDKPGGGYVRLDAYDPVAREIVSRKFTQLGAVQEGTGIGYLRELAAKYPSGARIANVPSSGPLAGRFIQGRQILEVPIQTRPIPQAVLSEASRLKILIRDVAGNVYR